MSREKDVPEKAHAELGASAASRWMACPGSINLSRGIPNVGSEFAQEGTAAHALAELALKRGVDPDMWEGMTLEGVEVTEDMAEHVRVFVNYCRRLQQSATESWIEAKFNLEALNPPGPMFGTADFSAYDAATRTLEVVDLKFGRGVVVEAKDNKQLRYYGLGAALALGVGREIETVKLTIVQPRVTHPDGVVRSEEIPYEDLIGFAVELMEAARRTADPRAPLAAGRHCKFCLALPRCPEQLKQAQALAQVEFDSIPADLPPAPEILPPALFAEMLPKLEILEQWVKAMKQHAHQTIERGGDVPGYKLVNKRATRKWRSEEQVRRWLDERNYADTEILDMSLKTPAQIEKLVGKKSLPEEFVKKESSGFTLTEVTDARPAVVFHVGEEFAALPPADTE